MDYCCETMKAQLEHDCEQCGKGKACPDVLVFKGELGYYLEARNATYACYFCPWCGKDLGGWEDDRGNTEP